MLVFVLDRSQTRDAIRRNTPVTGRFRGLLGRLGEFLRQYSFAPDREALPFNRALRDWVRDASGNLDDARLRAVVERPEVKISS